MTSTRGGTGTVTAMVPKADPFAHRLLELPTSALNKVVVIADGDEFWLHSWTLRTYGWRGEEYMEVVWRRPADLSPTGRLPVRLRFAMWLRRITLR